MKLRIPFYRSFGIKTITKFTKQASYRNLTDAQSGFRGYNRHAIETMNLAEDGMQISTEILLRAGSNKLTVTEVPVTIDYDVENASTHNFLSHGMGVLFSVIQFISFTTSFNILWIAWYCSACRIWIFCLQCIRIVLCH